MRVAFDRFVFDSDTRELLENGQRLHVSPKAFEVLHLLLEQRPRVVSKAELHDRVWAGSFVGDANLSVTVAEIRQAIGDDPKEGKVIRTVHRVGYAFCGEATDEPVVSSRSPFARAWLRWNEKTFPLAEGENVVGRDPRCAIWVDASGVSRRHAKITMTGSQATLEDLASSNGTFVGGRQVTAARPLADGDVIELGTTGMTFRLWSEDQPQKTERIRKKC
jgi:DNA-binding winged helix-turn-helix (wHTH) protein